MAELYPLVLSLILLFGYLIVAFLAGYAVLPGHLALRWHRVAVVPAGMALGLLAILLLRFNQPSVDLAYRLFRGGLAAGPWRLSPWAGRAVVAIVVLAAINAVYVTAHAIPQAVARWPRWHRHGTRPLRADVTRGILLMGLVVAIGGSAFVTRQIVVAGRQRSAGGRVTATHILSGAPTGMTINAGAGYITFGEGQIGRIALSADGSRLEVEIVAEGLTYPRGPLVVDDQLLIVDLGRLACADPFPQCWTSEPRDELARIESSSARVLAYPISDDGSLGEPREVLGALPVANTEHAPGSLSAGPDGSLHLTIGGPDRLPTEPELLNEIVHPNAELLGTVVRFRPGDTDVEVVASGLRNVFDVAFDPEGRIIGVDNGGEAARGWRVEQLVEIVPGADYGYPSLGTFNESAPPPLWILDARGSAGIAWTEVGEDVGVLVGSFGELSFVPLESDADGLYVPGREVVREVLGNLAGFVTAVQPLGGELVAITVFDPAGTVNALQVIELTPRGG